MKYTNQLAKPIKAKRLSLLATESDFETEAGRITAEKFAKLPDLCAAHGVIYGDWLSLALALATEHVSGFKIALPAGRPTEWGDFDKAMFRLDVEDMQSASVGLPVTLAIDRVRKLSQWAEKTHGMKVTALSKHFYSVDSRWVQIARDARSMNQLTGTNNS
jgi:hypothetical protein